jgi:hypothetical protein
MSRLTAFAIGAFLALSTIALARGETPIAGIWKLSIGKADAPCTLILASDASSGRAGAVTPSSDCATGLQEISRWRETPFGLDLFAPCGGRIASLRDTNGAFEGARLTDGKALVLDR